MKVKNVLFLFSILLVAACSGGGSGGSSDGLPTTDTGGSPNTSPNQPCTKIIDNEDLTAGLKGIDANNNGIRDDIDRLIAQKYSLTPAMKKAAEQEARALQKILSVTNKVQARMVFNESRRAGDCTYKVFSHATPEDINLRDQMSKEVEALTANTKERFAAYWQANSLAGGMVFSQAQEPVCD